MLLCDTVLSDMRGRKDGLPSDILLFIFHDIAKLSQSYSVKAVVFVMIRRPLSHPVPFPP